MITVISESDEVSIPTWVVDLNSFCRWAHSKGFPETGRIWYLKGGVWVDMTREQLFSHLAVKNEVSFTITGLVKAGKLGRWFPDGTFLSNITADFAGVPDGVFISTTTLQSDRLLIEGKEGGYVEIEGTPDLVLEVVSPSSVRKDTVLLRRAYWEADIPEYWLIDARTVPLKFDILRHTTRGYVTTRKQGGWLRSAVFGRAFRLTHTVNGMGHPEYTLEVQ
jgi:Uma2 family endonuclease